MGRFGIYGRNSTTQCWTQLSTEIYFEVPRVPQNEWRRGRRANITSLPLEGGKAEPGTAGGARGRGNCGQAMLYMGGRGKAVCGGQGLGWATRGATSTAVEQPVDEVMQAQL